MTRCEDWPCCGHGDDCPEHDVRGNEVWKCVECGRRLPLKATSSICSKCQRRLSKELEDGGDFDYSMNY